MSIEPSKPFLWVKHEGEGEGHIRLIIGSGTGSYEIRLREKDTHRLVGMLEDGLLGFERVLKGEQQ